MQLHPDTACAHGLTAGQPARLVTAHGEAVLPVSLNPGLRPDTLFVPFHWPESANLLTDPHSLDPHSRMPAFKATAVRLLPAHQSATRPLPHPDLTPLTGGSL